MYQPQVAAAAAAAAAQGQQQQWSQPKFKVIKALGRGSYGTVYKVQRLADGQVYAMKETDLGKMSQQERADAVNEIRLLGSLHHPNVVRHHETFLAGNKLCIVMEFAPAGDLAGFIKAAAGSRLPLPEATIWQILLQLCQGMQAVHDTCVIHRDIKPANIFMCPDNVVKVGDLGVAKALTRAHYAQTQIGTPVFMAPEVWRGLPYSYSSDLWSLGCMLYEMMTYRLPFDARSMNELKNKVILAKFAPITPGQPYSQSLVNICHALLNRDPRKRPTCAAILNSPEAEPWLKTVPEAVRLPLPPLNGAAEVPRTPAPASLLPTIRVPKDIRLLPAALPKPSYTLKADGSSIGSAGPGHSHGHQPQQQQQQVVSPPKPAAAPAPSAAAAAAAAPRERVAAAAGSPAAAAAAAAAVAAAAARPRSHLSPAAAGAGVMGAAAHHHHHHSPIAGVAPGAAMRPRVGPSTPAAAAAAPAAGVPQRPGSRGGAGPVGVAPAGFRAPGTAAAAAAAAVRAPGLGGMPKPPSGGGRAPGAAAAAGGVVPGSHRAVAGVGAKPAGAVGLGGGHVAGIGAYPGANAARAAAAAAAYQPRPHDRPGRGLF